MEKNDETGNVYGRLTVISFVGTVKRKDTRWLCRCDCGNVVEINRTRLRFGKTQSCGCLRTERIVALNYRHGESNTRLYKVYTGMKNRCFNQNEPAYPDYGGRGITMDPRWKDDFLVFKSEVPPHPGQGYYIERIDNNGNYEPGNVKWATRIEQNRNKRSVITVTLDGKDMCIAEAADILGVPAMQISKRRSVPNLREVMEEWKVEAERLHRKITPDVIRTIKEMIGNGVPVKEIEAVTGVSNNTIYKIRSGKIHHDV